jgi:hypothetical protein
MNRNDFLKALISIPAALGLAKVAEAQPTPPPVNPVTDEGTCATSVAYTSGYVPLSASSAVWIARPINFASATHYVGMYEGPMGTAGPELRRAQYAHAWRILHPDQPVPYKTDEEILEMSRLFRGF